jgi:hypothetical protein
MDLKSSIICTLLAWCVSTEFRNYKKTKQIQVLEFHKFLSEKKLEFANVQSAQLEFANVQSAQLE